MSPLPLRKLVNAIERPSGDQLGASLPTTLPIPVAAGATAPPARRSAPAPRMIDNRSVAAVCAIQIGGANPGVDLARARLRPRADAGRLPHRRARSARGARARSDARVADDGDRPGRILGRR